MGNSIAVLFSQLMCTPTTHKGPMFPITSTQRACSSTETSESMLVLNATVRGPCESLLLIKQDPPRGQLLALDQQQAIHQ